MPRNLKILFLAILISGAMLLVLGTDYVLWFGDDAPSDDFSKQLQKLQASASGIAPEDHQAFDLMVAMSADFLQFEELGIAEQGNHGFDAW
ncbi:MAG: hypothetical protein F6K11_37800, partial [Leptolyngbya sp. SIO3F4]|nr:hypothetical protein [Leptolyngbya sp. SIO3F4]